MQLSCISVARQKLTHFPLLFMYKNRASHTSHYYPLGLLTKPFPKVFLPGLYSYQSWETLIATHTVTRRTAVTIIVATPLGTFENTKLSSTLPSSHSIISLSLSTLFDFPLFRYFARIFQQPPRAKVRIYCILSFSMNVIVFV